MGVLRVWLGLATLAVSVNAQADVFGVDPISPSVCLAHQATCSDGSCIAKARVCDGSRDCPDASDENGCGDAHRCQPNEFRCSFNNTKCVQKDWRCDGDDDCGDNSDEADCDAGPPGSECSYVEFQCETGGQFGAQCIPRSFHCDGQADCQDQSDEVGCSAPIFVSAMPATLYVRQGDVFVLNCKAMGIPTPEVIWRLNWGHVPDKCNQISEGGEGTLSCPEAVPSDQGAYSCEAMNIKGSRFAVPDTVVIVSGGSGICQPPDFNTAALSNDDCQRCFCFGATTDCYSSSLFAETMTPARPNEIELRTVARISPELVVEPPSRDSSRMLRVGARGEVTVTVTDSAGRGGTHYFSLPPSYRGPHLGSYGGYIRYILDPASQSGRGRLPDVILSGNDITIWHRSDIPQSGLINLKIAEGTFDRYNPFDEQVPASREDIMMVLQDIDLFLIAVPRSSNGFQGTLITVQLDTAIAEQSLQGTASLVEECRCPTGYKGMSCEDCAPGYERQSTGQWLGRCVEQQKRCPSGEYGDPQRGIACQPCQCPGSSNQYGQTCRLDTDDQVTCDCLPGYMGRRCGRCTPGYRGNPAAGEPCTAGGECDAAGSMEDDPDPATGRCRCKAFATGSKCDRCKARAFFLHEENRHGCINCLCMGVTDQCRSSSWYRSMIRSVFTNHDQGFYLSVGVTGDVIDGGFVDGDSRELTYGDIPYTDRQPIYWMFPALYLSNKITSYGGDLRFVLHYDSQSRTTQTSTEAPDIEIFGNDIRLQHRVPTGVSSGRLVPVSVPFYEQYWRRDDGNPADREHLLMALANLEYIAVKATHGDNTQRVALSNVSMDTATARNNGVQRAHAVEQCSCPTGYKGLSCENCDVGYTRSLSGLYLRHCELCECNGHSEQCDPEVGECLDCRDNTYGANCERCAPGYIGDPQQGQLCRPDSSRSCQCDPRGSTGRSCDSRRQCPCKTGAAGPNCDRCRPGYFALMAQNREGCMRCFCSGVSQQCSEANVYRTQTQMQLIDEQHEFTLSNRFRNYIVPGDRFSLNTADNEIGFNQFAQEQPNGLVDILYWSLPPKFLGNQLRSYDGKLKVRQRFDQRLSANPLEGFDIILSGNGITLTWNNPSPLQPGRMNSYEVALSEEAGWTFTDNTRNIQRAATREELMQVLSGIGSILIRAVMSDAMRATYLSNVAIDTAIYTDDRQGVARGLEQCRCPTGYIGLSCEDCAPGHYRVSSEPFSSCRKCPCSDNEETCFLRGSEVTCRCKPGFVGPYCRASMAPHMLVAMPRDYESVSEAQLTVTLNPSPTARVEVGSHLNVTCSVRSAVPDLHVELDVVDYGAGLWRVFPQRQYERTAELLADPLWKPMLGRGGLPAVPAVRCRVRQFRQLIAYVVTQVFISTDSDVRSDSGFGAPEYRSQSQRVTSQFVNSTDLKTSGTTVVGGSDITTQFTTEEDGNTNMDYEDARYSIPSAQRVGRSHVYIRFANNRTGNMSRIKPEEPMGTEGPYAADNDLSTITSVSTDDIGGIENVPMLRVNESFWAEFNKSLEMSIKQESPGGLPRRSSHSASTPSSTLTADSSGGRDGQKQWLQKQPDDDKDSSITVTIIEPLIVIRAGETATFRCSGESRTEPQVEIRWLRPNGPLSDRAVDDGRGTLVIRGVTSDDSGVYICEVRDSVSTNTRETQLNVGAHGGSSGRGGDISAAVLLLSMLISVFVSRSHRSFSHRTKRLRDAVRTGGATFDAPSATISPPWLDLTVGAPAQLECTASGAPSQIKWSRRRGPIHPDVSLIDGLLVIGAVRKYHEDEYECTVRNADGSDTSRAIIYVREPEGGSGATVPPPPTPQPPVRRGEVTPQEMSVRPGDLVQIRCTTEDVNSQIVWSKEQGQLSERCSQSDGTLVIRDLQPNDGGVYVCTITSVTGQRERHTARIDVVPGQRLQLPTARVDPSSQSVPQGTSFQLSCFTSGVPTPAVSWRKSRGELPSRAVVRGDRLTISDARTSDRGHYICQSENSEGVTVGYGTVEVEPREPPVIQIHPRQDVKTTVGSPVFFQCLVTGGTPAPTVSWSRADGAVLPGTAQIQPGGLLRFAELRGDEAGSYECTATNPAGVVKRRIRLELEAPPSVTLNHQSPHRVQEGERVVLECLGSGDPLPSMSWTRQDGLPLPYVESSGPQQLTRRLVFESVSFEDAGEYVCQASSRIGQQQQRLRLDVERSPSEPYLRPNGGPFNGNQPFLQPNRVPLNGNQPFLQPNRIPPNGNQPYSQQYRVPLNGNAELRCYFPDMDQSVRVVWTRSDGRPLPENHQLQDGTLFIYNVQKDAEGLYSCSGFAANSEVVLSTDVQAYLVVVEPPHIQLNPKKQVVRPGDNVYIYCTATGDQPIQLNWSKVDGQLPRSVSIRDGELNFRRIAVSDAGRYLCVAKNSVAHAEGIAEVVVHDGASIVAVDSDVVTTEGMSVELRCQSSGTQARVTWRRDAGYMPRSAVVRGSSVRIPYAKQSASGQYICEAEDGTGHVVRDSVRLTVQPVGGVTARIRSSPTDGPVREGDTIDLTCEVTGAPDSRITWDRLEGRMLGNALARGPLLRLHKLQSDNEGVYRCTIRTSSGQTYTEEHVLSVTARDPPAGSNLRRRDARPEIVRAQLGYPGILSCRSPLNSPYTTYSWTKTDYPLAQPITINQAELRFDAVRLRDAGSYVCRSSDGRGDVDSVSYLLVTDVVPSFSQQANSYAQLDTIPDAYLGFDMELSFRPQLYDGLILYNGQNPSGGETRGDRSGRDATDGDFVSFGLSDGYPELRFSMNGQRSTVVRSRRHVTPGQWHSVRLRRHGARGKMVLDGEEVAEAAGEDDHVKMDLTEPLYIGGVPDFTAVHPDNGFKIGYSGCISRLSVSGVTYNISGGDVTVGRGLDVCDVCGSEGALCDNGAQCQEAFSPHGHRCLCTDNYTGETCSAPGYSCSPDSCGSGRCVNEDGGFRCLCPFGKIGDQCEEDVLITEPSFDGDGYMTFGTPRAIRRLEFELRLKPDKLEDGLVFYAAGNEHSQGDFAALVIKNEHIEFRYNDGLGVGTLRSPSPLQQGEWIRISGSREASNTTLRVNNGDLLESQSTVRTRGLNLRTPLYLGGTDPLRMRPDPAAVGVRRGFSGCVTSLRVGGTEVSLLRAHTGAANVRQCPQVDRPCARRPCQHGARCRDTGPQSADYVCSCTPGYTGVNCQLIVDPCLTHNPCENGGVCSSSATGRVHCGCLLGFFGEHCQKEAVLEGSVAFDGHSYVELPPSLKSHSGNKHVQESQTVQIRFNTEYDGLLFYHGQTPQDDGSDKDYVALAVRQGRPEMSFQLGSGPVRITLPVRVDDGRTHTLRMQRTGRDGLLQLDDGQQYSREGSAPGVLTMLNTKGNIYLGGVPEYARMTGDRFSTGFSGCIHELRIQDVHVSFVNSALSAINVSPCQQADKMAIPDVLPDVMHSGISNSRYDVVDYPDPNLLYRPESRTELRENGGPSTDSPYSDDLYDDYGDLEIYDNDEYYDVDSWSNE